MKITWVKFDRNDGIFELLCHSKQDIWLPNHDPINLYCMIDTDVLVCKVYSPNTQDIVDILQPILGNYQSLTFVENYASSPSGFPSLLYFEMTEPSEIIQFRLTYS